MDRTEVVVEFVGEGAKLTKLGCIVKMKDGKEKVRLIVDCRRSGINGFILPRVSDVAQSVHALFLQNNRSSNLEFCIADFRDAVYTLPLRANEKKYAVVKGGDNKFYLMQVVCFGFACGPVLWSRLAAVACRIAQASITESEGRLQTYVDDPIIVAWGPSHRARSVVFCRFLLLWVILGLGIAWNKFQRGTRVSWIGVQLELLPEGLRVTLGSEKTAKLLAMFDEIRAHGNLILPKRSTKLQASLAGSATLYLPLGLGVLCCGEQSLHQKPLPNLFTTARGFAKASLFANKWIMLCAGLKKCCELLFLAIGRSLQLLVSRGFTAALNMHHSSSFTQTHAHQASEVCCIKP